MLYNRPTENHIWMVTGKFPAQMASNRKMFPFDDVTMFVGKWVSHYT